jgi:glutaminase
MSTSAHDSPVTRGVSASESGGAKSIEVLDRDEIESILRSNGLDPESTHVAAELEKAAMADGRTIRIDTAHKHSVLSKVLTNQLAVPNWQEFVADVQNTFTEVHATVHGGQNADYIPILAKADPTQFVVAVCTVDG